MRKSTEKSKMVKAPAVSRGSREASGRPRRIGSRGALPVAQPSSRPTVRQARSRDASKVGVAVSLAARRRAGSKRNAKAAASRDASVTVLAAKRTSKAARVGFVCPPCGRFVPTLVEGVVLRVERGSPPRFCSPGCRQAAYRRRQAGVGEDVPLQLGGGRDRSLKQTRGKTARPGRKRDA
jgi:hypothetical protein